VRIYFSGAPGWGQAGDWAGTVPLLECTITAAAAATEAAQGHGTAAAYMHNTDSLCAHTPPSLLHAGKQRHVGRFDNDVTAAKAYDKAAVYLYGSNAM
jgi:hypothetical protein